MQDLFGRTKAEAFSGAGVESLSDIGQVALGQPGEIRPFGKVIAQLPTMDSEVTAGMPSGRRRCERMAAVAKGRQTRSRRPEQGEPGRK